MNKPVSFTVLQQTTKKKDPNEKAFPIWTWHKQN